MGGRGRIRTQRKHFKQSRENVWKRTKSEPSADNNNNGNDKPAWQPFATQNPAFEEYYKEQGIVSPEEWDSFIEVLRKPLPAAFRINSSSQFCSDIRVQLENDFMKSLQAEVTDGEEEAIRPLPWYPENLAWHSNFSRMQLRKNQTLERFHEFLKLENEIGNITRQEAVSMVPPLFLDVLPFHFVLDMCAAPGSKTFQLLEIIHQSTKAGSLPDGMVVANDLDVQRCNLLIHQTKRMCTANLIVTNHEAQHFPGCRSNRKCSSSSESAIRFQMSISQLIFDRVLCDVPCSGDGTLRKAPDIWRKWNAGLGNGFHCLQVQIAMRGLSLLKVGGRMVYSTCSMNPVENEAVVAEILRKCGGSLELIDVSCELPQLVRRPGLKKWKVRDKGTWFVSFKDVPKYRRSVIVPSMFPSGRRYVEQTENNHDTELGEKDENGCSGNSEDGFQPIKDPVALADELDGEVCTFPLERCMRIMPHDQNSGAFFIAVFHKLSPLPAMQEKSSCLQGDDESFVKPPNQILEDSNGVEVISGVGTDEKFSEAASEADLIDNERDDEPFVKPPNQILEDSNGVEVISGVGTDEKFSEAASEADLIDTESGGAASESPLCSTCDEPNSENAQAPDHMETDPRKVGGKRKLQKQGKWKGVDPVVFFKDEAVLNSIKAFYGIDDSFPLNGHLVTRNSDTNHVKRIYYISKSVKDVLELNFSVGQQLKITSIGMKMFERQTSREGSSTPCAFRISSEGLPLILPCITKQILYASLVDFKHLLQYKSIKFSDFVDTDFGKKASNLLLGCCVIVLRKGSGSSLDHTQVDESTIAIGCWKGRGSLTVMVTGIDCQELLERLVVRMEAENSSLVPEEKSCVEADKVQDMKGIEKHEDMESNRLATELN